MVRWTIAAAGFALFAAATQQEVALKDLMPTGMVIGVAINQRPVRRRRYGRRRPHHEAVQQISPENVLKFRPLHPAADRYTFDAADRYVQFGVDRRMQVVGHNLVWHNQTGAWIFQGADGKPADRDTLLSRMRDHIRTVVGRYKGKIHGWDVVNEAIDEDGSMRKSPWQTGIGDDYAAKAFEIRARRRSRRRAVLQRLQSRDEDGEACRRDQARKRSPGAQAARRRHRQPGALASRHTVHRRDRQALVAASRHRAEGDVHRAATSTCCRIRRAAPILRDRRIRTRTVCLTSCSSSSRGATRTCSACSSPIVLPCTRVTFWGLSDADSWLNRGRMNYPLLWDRERKPKPAFDAVVDALRSAR